MAVDDALARVQRHIAAAHVLAVDHLAVLVADEEIRLDGFGRGNQIAADHQRRVGRVLPGVIRPDHLRDGNGQTLCVVAQQIRFFVAEVVARKDDERAAQHREGHENHQKDDCKILFEQSGRLFAELEGHADQSLVSNLYPTLQTVSRLHFSETPLSFSRRRLMCTSTVREESP